MADPRCRASPAARASMDGRGIPATVPAPGMIHQTDDMDMQTQTGIGLAVDEAVRQYEQIVAQGDDFEIVADVIARAARDSIARVHEAYIPLLPLYTAALHTLRDIDHGSLNPRAPPTYQ